jgi:hypothetical protein
MWTDLEISQLHASAHWLTCPAPTGDFSSHFSIFKEIQTTKTYYLIQKNKDVIPGAFKPGKKDQISHCLVTWRSGLRRATFLFQVRIFLKKKLNYHNIYG